MLARATSEWTRGADSHWDIARAPRSGWAAPFNAPAAFTHMVLLTDLGPWDGTAVVLKSCRGIWISDDGFDLSAGLSEGSILP